MNESNNTNAGADVVVIGAGPVGMTLALLVARKGHSVRIFERHAGSFPLPRAVGMSHETMRAFQTAGIMGALAEQMDMSSVWEVASFFTGEGEVLMTQGMPGNDLSGYPAMAAFNQPDLEALLVNACNAHEHINLEWGWAAETVTQTDATATVALTSASGEARTETAQFVVGCDGGNSTIVRQMDVGIEDTGFSSTWLIVDLIPEGDLYETLPFGQCLDPARPTTIVPGGPGRRRFEMMLLDGEDPEEMVKPERLWPLIEGWGVNPGNSELVRSATYTFGGRWAEQWRDGRVLVAGDAAHVMPPFMAQGFNSGVRDALTLAWKLDLVLSGRSAAGLLDTYTTERLPHVRTIVEQSVGVGQMICILDPEQAAGRDAMLRMAKDNPEMAPPPPPPWRLGPGVFADGDPHAGLLAVQATVGIDGKDVLLDDHLGGVQWCLLSGEGNPGEHLSEDSKAGWDRLGGQALGIGGASGHTDVEGRYGAWLEELGVNAVLVRPDFHIFGTAATPADIDSLVADLLSQL